MTIPGDIAKNTEKISGQEETLIMKKHRSNLTKRQLRIIIKFNRERRGIVFCEFNSSVLCTPSFGNLS